MLINIDNGGTFTDICAIKGSNIHRVKTPTTPFDLSECFFEGLRKISEEIYGSENLASLFSETEKIRYSTTQGTNALVQRKGPKLGLLLQDSNAARDLRDGENAAEIYDALLGDRIVTINMSSTSESIEAQVVDAVNELTLAGANRLVLSLENLELEKQVEQIVHRRFPEHLLGTVPVVPSSEISPDPDISKRTWAALFNSFLHPSMEKFLYYAENRLRAQKFNSPLLIYRNDGDSGKIAKTTAIKTYSSGPRGGMDGAKALADFYKFKEILSMDVGGTTTDIGLVTGEGIRKRDYGVIEGASIAFPLTDIVSVGVGGGSIIREDQSEVKVGPESVGSAPGPACFGLGGTNATITDFALLAGIIDPATYFGGTMNLDAERSKMAVQEHVATALGVDLDQALCAMEKAWVNKVANVLTNFTAISDGTVLGGFGGAGPLAVCSVAETAGIKTIIIPKMAAVFCALGIGFSDVGHSYELAAKNSFGKERFDAFLEAMKARAVEDMLGEGFEAKDCRFDFQLVDTSSVKGFSKASEVFNSLSSMSSPIVRLRVSAQMAHPSFGSQTNSRDVSPVPNGSRNILQPDAKRKDVPFYEVKDQPAGARGDGPAVIEDPYFTLRVLPNWSFKFTNTGDILLSRKA